MASEAEKIIGLYQRHGLAWAEERETRLIEGAWLERFLGLLPPKPRILDIGCGSADPIGRHLIASGCSVTGVDSAPALIDLCRDRFPEQEWQVADMRTLSFGRPFNGLLAWDSLFHLSPEGQRQMFPVFRRNAAQRAALMFTSGNSYGVAMGTLGGEPLYHASLDPAEYRALLNVNGFEVVAHTVEDATCGHRTIWLSQLAI